MSAVTRGCREKVAGFRAVSAAERDAVVVVAKGDRLRT